MWRSAGAPGVGGIGGGGDQGSSGDEREAESINRRRSSIISRKFVCLVHDYGFSRMWRGGRAI